MGTAAPPERSLTGIDRFTPSVFFQCGPETDLIVRDVLRRYDPVLVDLATDDYNLRRFRAAAFNFIPLLRSLPIDLKNTTMLEVGCGRGLKGLAWADLVGRYIGVDLSPEEVRLGQTIRERAGRPTGELVLGDAAEIVRDGRLVKEGEVGILVLYAVLEHLLPNERVEVMRFARRCFDQGAVVLIAETPNRLVPFDHHTTERHFFQMLPDHLAIRHLRRFPGHRVTRVVEAQEGDTDTMLYQLYRYGRGMSYHDFELDFCDGPIDLRLVIDGYHPALLDHQPPTRAELDLQRYFGDNALQAPRCFSRSWLDMFLWKGSAATPPSSVQVLHPRDGWRTRRVPGREFWNMDRFVTRRRAGMEFELPASAPGAKVSLLVDADQPESGVEVAVDGDVVFSAAAAELLAMRPPTWHKRFVIPLQAAAQPRTIRVGPPKGASFCAVAGILVDSN